MLLKWFIIFSLVVSQPLLLNAQAVFSNLAPSAGLIWDSTIKEGTSNPGEFVALFTFSVTNNSASEIIIDRIEASCGCTKVELPASPWKLAPREGGRIDVSVDGRGKTGTLVKTLMVYSSVGPRSLTVKAHLLNSPAPETNSILRKLNQQEALGNRQAVFQGKCAACHLVPATGKNGLPLYQTACGICHAAKHRATMVPDLKALKVTTSKAYWENWIRNGKPGSLMPAFEQKQGGPLTEAQIQSLVGFLSSDKDFAGSTNSEPTESVR